VVQGRIEHDGRRVLYGDTDSLSSSRAPRTRTPPALRRSLAALLNRELAAHIAQRWRVTSRLELVFDRLYLRLCLPSMRHDAAGARKRYAGLAETKQGPKVVFTGMEAVRSDGRSSRSRCSARCMPRLFADQPVEQYLRETVARCARGELDDQLAYRKAAAQAARVPTRPPPRRTSRSRASWAGAEAASPT